MKSMNWIFRNGYGILDTENRLLGIGYWKVVIEKWLLEIGN